MRSIAFFLFFVLLVFPTKAFASSVVINEIMAYPSSGEKEWVELMNTSSSEANLDKWTIREKTASGNTTPHSLPSVLMPANSLCYFEFSISSLNNDGDTVSLNDQTGAEIDSYKYTSTVQAKTFSRVPDGGTWQSNQTASKTSIICSSLSLIPSPTPTPSNTPSPTSTPIPTPTPSQILKTSPTPNPTTISVKPQITPSPTPTLSPPPPIKTSYPVSPASIKNVNDILGIQSTNSATVAADTSENKTAQTTDNNFSPKLLSVLGISFIVISGVLGWILKQRLVKI